MSKDGGPAFPNSDDVVQKINRTSGMTLRDWFAGQALAGLMANKDVFPCNEAESAFRDRVATEAVAMADAMIAEREKPR